MEKGILQLIKIIDKRQKFHQSESDDHRMMWSWQECPAEVTLWQCSAF